MWIGEIVQSKNADDYTIDTWTMQVSTAGVHLYRIWPK